MISSPVLSTQDDRDELLRGARSNVGLVADTVWAPIERDDSFRKLNRDLWKRICKIAASYDEITNTRTKKKRVRDIIPESRLSLYGDFEYEDDAEEYDECEAKVDPGPIKNGGAPTINAKVDDDDEDDEDELKAPWLLDEVEEFVVWVKKAWKSRRPIGCKSLSKSDNTLRESQEAINHTSTIQDNLNEPKESIPDNFKPPPPPRFSVTNVSEAQLEGRIFSESVRDLWRSTPGPSLQAQQQQQQQEQLVRGLQRELVGLLRPHQTQKRCITPSTSSSSNSSSPVASDIQQTHFSFQNERLKMPNRCQYSYVQAINMVHHRPLAPLCVDVPEFFPKGPGAAASWPIEDNRISKPVQYFSENPYQEDPFPHKSSHVQPNRKTVTLYQNTLVPMVATPMVPAMVWPAQAWAQQPRMIPAPIAIHHQMQPPPPPPPQPPPQQPPGVVQHRAIRIQEAVKPVPIQPPQPTQVQQSQQLPPSHKGQIPVYQRQSKPSQDYSQQRRKSQGVDFNNLILLTKSAMKLRRTQTKGTKKFFSENAKLQGAAAAAAAAAVNKADAAPGSSTSRWFDKGSQPKREREYVTVATTVPRPSRREERAATVQELPARTEPPSSRKRLYRDVLESSSTATPQQPRPSREESNFEKRYDELERQAMEQYRNSEECLAQRYQELEQQALEQYRNAESSESINLDSESNSANSRKDDFADKAQEKNDKVDNKKAEASQDEKNDQSPQQQQQQQSGFGKSSRSKKAIDDDEKGSSHEESRIKILKPDSGGGGGGLVAVHRAASEGSLRPIAVARRLNAGAGMGANSYLRDSKNASRGASEKIVKTSSLSSLKRRLMPMSPLDRAKSGGGCNGLVTKGTGDPGANYRNAKVFHHQHPRHHLQHHHQHHHQHQHRQIGSGDDKANNIGVWLSDFWS